MGSVENITHEKFPRQMEDAGKLVAIIIDKKSTPAVVLRSDAESPNRRILKTLDGKYISRDELESFREVRQGTYLGKRTDVCFHYDTRHIVQGRIVRDDMEKPGITFIKLDDGRIVYATECQYSPVI